MLGIIQQIEEARGSQAMWRVVQPDLISHKAAKNLLRNATLRAKQSVNPRLRSNDRHGAAEEIPGLVIRATLTAAELASKPTGRVTVRSLFSTVREIIRS